MAMGYAQVEAPESPEDARAPPWPTSPALALGPGGLDGGWTLLFMGVDG
jgi:hypothetical protein